MKLLILSNSSFSFLVVTQPKEYHQGAYGFGKSLATRRIFGSCTNNIVQHYEYLKHFLLINQQDAMNVLLMT